MRPDQISKFVSKGRGHLFDHLVGEAFRDDITSFPV
jgi:hypothetical protein